MIAIVLREFGPPGVLRGEEAAEPVPAAGQVRIAVRAAGAHRLDTWIRAGLENEVTRPLPEPPVVLGREVAGVVDAVGEGVDRAWLGRRVVVHLGPAMGGYAELAVCAVTSALEIPPDVEYDVAVAMIGTGRTALGVLDVAGVTAEDVVVVTGATGGVGCLIVQYLARVVGATVIGLAGDPAKLGRLLEDGAAHAVVCTRPGWTDEVRERLDGRPVSVVLDGVGGEVGRSALEVLGPGGRFVFFGWASGRPTQITTTDLYERGLSATAAVGPTLLRRGGGARALQERALAAAAEGTLSPRVERYALREAAAAHQALEERRTVGKVVLVP